MESGYFSEWLKSYRNYLRMRNYSPRHSQQLMSRSSNTLLIMSGSVVIQM